MTVFEIVAFVVAFALAGSQYIEKFKSVWAKLPSPVPQLVPAAVLVLAMVVQYFGNVPTTVPELVTGAVAMGLALVTQFAKKK